ncbi:hypothetical protein AAG906_022455 [Vitis piasezkii]
MEGNKNGTICNYCGLAIKSGGITRFKFHLSHTDPNSNTKKCPNVPPVKQQIRRLIEQRNKLRDTMGRRHRHVIDEDDEENLGGDGGGDGGGGGDDDDDGDDDVYMYPLTCTTMSDMLIRGGSSIKSSEWNRQQQEHFIKTKEKQSSHPTNPTTRQMRKSQSVRYSDPSLPDAPSLYKSSAARQKTVKNLFKGGAIKETMGRLIEDSHHFKNMIVGAQQAGNYYNFKSCIYFNNIITIYIV